MQILNIETTEKHFILTILNVKIKFRRHLYNLKDIFYKLTIGYLPDFYKLYIMGLFDASSRWLWEIRYRKFSYDEIFELFASQKEYPKNILGVKDTINYIIVNKCSLSRLGDGEEFLDNILSKNLNFPELREKLLQIIQHGTTSNCLVCINNFNADNEDCPLFYRKHFTHYYSLVVKSKDLKQMPFSNNIYGDAYALFFYLFCADKKEYEQRLEEIKKIWDNRKILFVINKDSQILKDEFCFDNTLKKDYIFIPKSNAYSEYDNVLNKITTNFDNSWLVYIAGGAMATVLAFELSQKGYQALDMGSFYERALYNFNYE